jgi:hypothetical protein
MKRAWIAAAAGGLLCVAGLGAWSLESENPPAEGIAAATAGEAGVPMVDAAGDPGAPVLALPATPRQGPPVALRLTEPMLRAALAHGTLPVRDAGGGRYSVRMVRGQVAPKGRWTVIGKVATRVGLQSMVLTFHGRDVFGVLPLPDGRQLAVTTTRGVVAVAVSGGMLPPGAMGVGNPDFAVLPASRKAAAAAPAGNAWPAATTATQEVQVDLLGLYSDELVVFRGSVDAAETEVISQVAIANQVHVDSGTRVRFALADLAEVTVPAGSYNTPLLSAITNNTLEGTDVRALRDAATADLVFLLRPYAEGDSTCGVGWLGSGELGRANATPDAGFSVSNVGTECGSYVVPHELGHNLGSMHDRETATDVGGVHYGAYPYSFGYRQAGPPGFATVMAYEVSGSPWVGYFSSPALTACGAQCGVADEADNVRSLDQVAPAVAAFRGPAGQIAPVDIEAVEPQSGEETYVSVPVRFYGGAPAGGLTLEVTLTGGTASAGTDFDAPASTTLHLAAGESEASLVVDILGDDAVEGDETLLLHVGSPDDHSIEGTLVLTIVDDDPRAVISGHVLIPAGAPAPAEGFTLHFGGLEHQYVRAEPPDFAYQVGVIRGAEISVTCAYCPAPFALPPAIALGYVKDDRSFDYPATKGVLLAGRVLIPDGDAIPGENIQIVFKESIPGEKPRVYSYSVASPDFSYRLYLWPGSVLNILVDDPPAPYQPYWFRDASVQGELLQDIRLSTLPSLVVWGADEVSERYHTYDGNDSVAEVLGLSAPAPAGGVVVTYSTRAGSAKAGTDFVAVDHATVVIPEGQTGAYASVEYIDDLNFEPDESLDIVVDDVEGAVPTVPEVRLVIHDNDGRTGGPGQKRQAP